MSRWFSRFVGVVFLSLFLAACGPKVSEGNFNKVTEGMPYQDVVKILGEPSESNGGKLVNECIWKSDKHQIKILFRDEVVETKEFSEISQEAVKSE